MPESDSGSAYRNQINGYMTVNKSEGDSPSVSLELNHVTGQPYTEEKVEVQKEDEFTEPEYLDEEITGPMRIIACVQENIEKFTTKYENHIKWGIFFIVLILFHVWLGFACHRAFDRAETLMIFTCIGWGLTIYYCIIKRFLHKPAYKYIIKPSTQLFHVLWAFWFVKLILYLIIIAAIAVFIIIDTKNDRKRLIGLCGMVFFLAFMFIMSKSPAKINWRPVIWGYLMQFVFGLLILRWNWGMKTFRKTSDQIVRFLDYTNDGTKFVYGFLANPPNICGMSAVFAFSSIQVVVYFGSIVSLLYYYGIMQLVLKKMAWFMQLTLGTTATESLNACACIFLGQSEAPLLIKPYIVRMTASEIHAIMTSGFACIAGSLFAAYISFGACPIYLLSATFMSAPGSLACSKILYPETEESQVRRVEDLELPKGEESNALECISNGAVMAVDLVLAIIANLIVFLALLAFADNVVGWIMSLLGYEGWTLEKVLGYIFFPIAYIMGVTDSDETLKVARLMGTKTILNEFIAYQQLGKMELNNELSPRGQMIATYALCGFSNFSSIGIQLGILGGMAPSKKPLLSKIALRALLAGTISCFWTASLAGLLVEEPSTECAKPNSGENCFNVTEYQDLLKNWTDVTSTSVPSTVAQVQNWFKTEL